MPATIHKQFHLSGHRGPVYALARKNEYEFFSAGSEGLIAHWNLDSSTDALATAKVNGQIFSIYYSKMREELLAGTMDGTLYVVNTKEHRQSHSINTQCDSIFDITYISELKAFALATKLGLLNLYDEDYGLIQRINVTDNSLRGMTLLPDSPVIAIAASDHHIYLFDYNKVKIMRQIEGPQHSVFSLAASPDGKYLLAGSRDACLYIFDVEDDFNLVKKIPAHLFTINKILFHPSGRFFFTAGRDKHIKLWDATTFELLKVIDFEKYEGHTNSVNSLLWMEKGNLLISAGDDKSIIGWRIEINS